MRQRMNNALQLLQQTDIAQLTTAFLALCALRPRFDLLMVALLQPAEPYLHCYYRRGTRQKTGGSDNDLSIALRADDFDHPLAHILRTGQSACWHNLQRGVHIEHAQFRQLVAQLPNQCGLYAQPLFNQHNQPCGVIALFAEKIDPFIDNSRIFSLYCQLFRYRLRHLYELQAAHYQQQQLRELIISLRERQQQLDSLLEKVTPPRQPGTATPFTHLEAIHNFDAALAQFEQALLRHRLRLYGADRQKMADSLGLSRRALNYKLSKHKGLL